MTSVEVYHAAQAFEWTSRLNGCVAPPAFPTWTDTRLFWICIPLRCY